MLLIGKRLEIFERHFSSFYFLDKLDFMEPININFYLYCEWLKKKLFVRINSQYL